ncbi:zf-HC2 domain-containing protein [Zhongshania sp. BJYM1]|uniref:zf-HC2 domain-containing protein n=1 Tax=Zhongshania aquatica TaxID=2965069 RepID=UPI0022B46EA5|nr:zf-HC2 domain-containing protein [Marortus sp. BJYM1]
MLNCKQFTDLASEHIDHEHTGWKRVEVRLHLIICRHCRRFNRHLDRSRQTGATIAQQVWRSDEGTSDLIFSRIIAAAKNKNDANP